MEDPGPPLVHDSWSTTDATAVSTMVHDSWSTTGGFAGGGTFAGGLNGTFAYGTCTARAAVSKMEVRCAGESATCVHRGLVLQNSSCNGGGRGVSNKRGTTMP